MRIYTNKIKCKQRISTLGIMLGLALGSSAILPLAANEKFYGFQEVSPWIEVPVRSVMLNPPALDGSGNNARKPSLGAANTVYRRIAPAYYSDGIGTMAHGPNLRYISNRVFADGAQNIFSENGVTQWAYNWAQFIDHSIGLKESGKEEVSLIFDEQEPLEKFSNSSQSLKINRSAIANGSGVYHPRDQLNTVSSFIDAWAVYGGSEERLEWLREGLFDGDLGNNGAHLLLTADGYLPTADIRGNADVAPTMERVGRLAVVENAGSEIVIAGDIRANENIALTTVQTLFAREHNRIVDALPETLSEQQRFDIARQIVIATQQYITYNEFLPTLGIKLAKATSYKPGTNPSISNEFATVAYRAHSMIHGEIEAEVSADRYDRETLEHLHNQGIETEIIGESMEIAVPLNVAFANPQLLKTIGIDAIAAGLGSEPQYKNDEQIDNQLRSVLFQLPNPEVSNPDTCLDGETLNQCFLLAMDLGLIDIFRARDHGIPNYNDLREAYGLARVDDFKELTGESTEEFIDDGVIDIDNAIDDPSILDFVELRDKNGNTIDPASDDAESEVTEALRRTTLASRLKSIYGGVDAVDAFVGMVSEAHLPGSEFGKLQQTMWEVQFTALRDGDSNFYLWSKSLEQAMGVARQHGIDYRQTLSEVIIRNTRLEAGDIQDNIFLVAD